MHHIKKFLAFLYAPFKPLPALPGKERVYAEYDFYGNPELFTSGNKAH